MSYPLKNEKHRSLNESAIPYDTSRKEIITKTLVSKIATVMNPTELYLVTVVVTHPVAIFRPTDPKGKVNALNVESHRKAKMATIIGDRRKTALTRRKKSMELRGRANAPNQEMTFPRNAQL